MTKQTEHEKSQWDRLFKEELTSLSVSFKLFPCAFWELYYQEITKYIDELLNQATKFPNNVLEAGCGSGKGSLLLKSNVNLTLVDISKEALKLALFLAKKLNTNKEVKYIQADLFNLPFPNNSYDLVWSAGTLEHYDKLTIKSAIEEMARVTKTGGYLVIGIPNPGSLAYKKAKILSNSFCKHWLKFIPGYRNDSERSYSPEDLCILIESLPNCNFEDIRIVYVGSYLFRDTPKFIIKYSRYADFIFNKYKFMYLISARKI